MANPDRPLSEKELRFVEAFTGVGSEACRAAGYRGSVQALSTQAKRLLERPRVRAALDARRAPTATGRIMSRVERQVMWTEVAEDPGVDMGQRLRASELLGKSEADFIERHEHRGSVTIVVGDPYK